MEKSWSLSAYSLGDKKPSREVIFPNDGVKIVNLIP